MKNIIGFIVCSMFAAIACHGQDSGCEKYKDGTFKLTDQETKQICIITRDGGHQTEKMENAEESYDFDVKWVDDCTYTVTPTAATVQKNKDVLKLGTMTVKITPVSDTSYVQTVRVANSPKFKRRDTVYMVKKEKKENQDKQNDADKKQESDN